MFAPAYMGRKRFFQMLSLHVSRGLMAGALDGAARRLLRPRYAVANMGHPSRESLNRRHDRFLLVDLLYELLAGFDVLVHQPRRRVRQPLSG